MTALSLPRLMSLLRHRRTSLHPRIARQRWREAPKAQQPSLPQPLRRSGGAANSKTATVRRPLPLPLRAREASMPSTLREGRPHQNPQHRRRCLLLRVQTLWADLRRLFCVTQRRVPC